MAFQNETQTLKTGSDRFSLWKRARPGIERRKWTMSDFTF